MIHRHAGSQYEPVILSIGGGLTINNGNSDDAGGEITGTVSALALNGQDNRFRNVNGGVWNTAGLSFFTTGGDNLVDNGDGSTINIGDDLLDLSLITFTAGNENVIDNRSGATINSTGINTLAFIDHHGSEVDNSGVLNVTGLTTFLGLDDFYNDDGLVDMQNGVSEYLPLEIPYYNTGVGDVMITTGNFDGDGDSELAIDAWLGGPFGNSSSDLMIVGGRVTGSTAVDVADLNPGPGVYNPVGIPVVGVLSGNTDLGDFYLENGPIDKGLFTFDLFLDETPGDLLDMLGHHDFDTKAWVLASYANSSAYALPQTMNIVQGMWNTTADSWIDRASDLRVFYGPAGGGGADLPVYEAPTEAIADPNNNGIWARVIGQVAERDVSYETEPFPISPSRLTATMTRSSGASRAASIMASPWATARRSSAFSPATHRTASTFSSPARTPTSPRQASASMWIS